MAPTTAPLPVLRLLYLLQHGDDICLDTPTAQSIPGEPFVHGQPVIADLLRVLKELESAGLVRHTALDPNRLAEADRDTALHAARARRSRPTPAILTHVVV